MKIITKIGNLLDIDRGHIVQGCNAQGVMNKGLAKQVRQKYPEVFSDYMRIHGTEGLDLGTAYPFCPTPYLVVWNAITQEYFGTTGRNCSYDAVQSCFEQINIACADLYDTGIAQEIHIPMIGSGLAGGNWQIIREIIEQTVTFPTTLWILDEN